MKKFYLLLALVLFTSTGCSLLKVASAPFKKTVSKVPQSIEKSERKIRCKGEIILDSNDRVKSCTQNYVSEESNFTQKERKLSLREKISQFILNVRGYILIFIVFSIFISLSGFGWIFGAIMSNIRGVGRVSKDLIKGISKGKKYVRQNGYKYSDKEREAYKQAVDDMLSKISNSVTSKQSKKIINKFRAEHSED